MSSPPKPPPGAPPSSRKPKVAPPAGPPPSSRRGVQPPSDRSRPQPPSERRPPPTRKKNAVAPPNGPPPSDRSRPSKRKPQKKQPVRNRKDSSSSSSSESSNDSGWVRSNANRNVYKENKQRVHLKAKNKYKEDDPPMKENNYHGLRMSQVLRGERDDLPLPGELIYEEDFSDYEPEGIIEYIQHAFFVKSKEKKFGPRAALCLMAVALLWMSSAAACRGFITLFIETPPYDEVESQVLILQDTISQQEDEYENCVTETHALCLEVFDIQISREGNRLQEVQNENIRIIQSEDNSRSFCRAEYEKALQVLSTVSFTQFGLNPPGVDCTQLEDLITPQIQQLESVDTAQQTADQSTAAVDDFERQLAEREAYDREYQQNFTNKFGGAAGRLRENLYNSTQFQEDLKRQQLELQACMSENGVIFDENGQVFECQGKAVLDEARLVIASYRQEYDDLNQTVRDFVNEVEGYVEDVERLQNFISAASFDFASIPTPSFADLEASFRLGLNGLGISDEQIDAFIAERERELEEAVAEAEREIDELNEEIARRQQEFLDNATREFNENFPGISEDTQRSANNSRNAANSLSSQVASDLESTNDRIGDVEAPTAFEAIINSTSVEFLQGIAVRTVNFFSYDDNIFFQLEANLNLVVDAFLIFDVFWRVFSSILLFKKYWKISAVATPPADVRSQKGKLFKEKKNVFQTIGGLWANPVVQVLVNIFIIFVVSILFYVAYTPLYNEFVSGCVENDFRDITNGNVTGTMIFRNLNTMTAGIAAGAGDSLVTQLIDGFNLERQLVCSDLLQNSVTVRQNHINTHTDLARNYNALAEKYNLFNDCIDWAAFDQNNPGLEFDMEPLFSAENCTRNILPINVSDIALHNCDEVQSCVHACGPNFVELARVNHNAACTGEYALHSYFLVGLFVATMFFCLNLSRFYFINGLIEVGWPTLCLDVYSYLLSCTERGTILPPKEVERGEPFPDVIKRALDKSLKKYTRKGYLDLFFALAINLPWIIFMSVFSQDITYRAR